jgi:diguanylate cyclase (GGDEF)-like protein/putative nucleotidyltransferase with HDIG domain
VDFDGGSIAVDTLPHHDPLTGLFNHSYFHDELESRLAHSQTNQIPLACILLDIDYFRELNEALGHRFGDEVLRQTAIELKSNLRQHDIASRYGGDKFGIILPETTMREAVTIADSLRITLSGQNYRDRRNATHITLSAGVTGTREQTRSKSEFLQQAEAALAEAKQKGRNRVCYWQLPVRQPPRDQHEQSAIDEIRERFADLQRDFKKHYLNSSMPMIEEMEAADGFLSAHSQNVARLSTRLARRLQLNQNEVDSINTAALLHDIGKLAIDGSILRKRTPLTATEFDLIKKHPLYGVSLLSHTRVFDEELPLILHHHERFDGDGYPHGLKGESIPLGSRIICIAEAFDGLTAGAVYRAAVSAEKALAELARCAGSHFDPELVTIMISLVRVDDNRDNHPEA